jgi:hypothetical protein
MDLLESDWVCGRERNEGSRRCCLLCYRGVVVTLHNGRMCSEYATIEDHIMQTVHLW